MKKTFAMIAALAVSIAAIAQTPEPQDKQFFNHLSIGAGIGIGVIEGVHFQVAAPITPHFQARVAYNTAAPVISLADGIVKSSSGISVKNVDYTIENVGIHSTDPAIDIDKIRIQSAPAYSNLSVMADFFPSAKGGFHITAGALFNFNPALAQADVTLMKSDGSNSISPSNWGTTRSMGVTTDTKGDFNVSLAYGCKTVQPYLGIGFGRPVSLKHRVGLNLDLGVVYVGGLHAYAKDYYDDPQNPVDVELNEAWLNSTGLKDEIGPKADDILKYVNTVNNFPVAPIIRLTLNVRLF